MKHRDPRLKIVVFVMAITVGGVIAAIILKDERPILGQIIVLLMLTWLIQQLRSGE